VSETCQLKIRTFSKDFAISLPEGVELIYLEEEGTKIPRNFGNH